MSSISWQCRIYIPCFNEPTITWVASGFSGYIWLDTKNCVEKKNIYILETKLFQNPNMFSYVPRTIIWNTKLVTDYYKFLEPGNIVIVV